MRSVRLFIVYPIEMFIAFNTLGDLSTVNIPSFVTGWD